IMQSRKNRAKANAMQKEKQLTPRQGVYIYLRGNFWMLRYRIPILEKGTRKLTDVYKKLATRAEYGSAKSVAHLAKPRLDALPDKLTTLTTQTTANFIEHTYFPLVERAGKL